MAPWENIPQRINNICIFLFDIAKGKHAPKKMSKIIVETKIQNFPLENNDLKIIQKQKWYQFL